MPGADHDTAMKLPATALPRATSGQAPGCGLHGRRGERGMLDRLVADVRAGQNRVLVLRGEPGTGKSALLDYLARRAAGCRVARVAGAEPETQLTFAGLHQFAWLPQLRSWLDTESRCTAGPGRLSLTRAARLGTRTAPGRSCAESGSARYPAAEPG